MLPLGPSLESAMIRTFAPAAALVMALLVSSTSAQGAPASDWQQPALGAALPPRSAMAAAYDPAHGKLVVFGGYDETSYLRDTWVFDGAGWTQVGHGGPSARAAASMAYDAVQQQLVLFGGFNGAYLGDTWIFDAGSNTWTNAAPANAPKAVTGPSLFTDPLNGHAVAYGGYDGMFYQLTTWRWTGTDWQQLDPSVKPWARAAATVSNDPAHGNVVLFGGLASVNPWNTWTWDGNNWTELSLALQPPNRYDGAAAFDPQLGGVVIFGGGSGGTDLDDTWLWTGSQWKELHPNHKPAPRESHAMAQVPSTGVVVVGGENAVQILGDTWALAHHDDFSDSGPGVGGPAGAPVLAGGGDLTPASAGGFTLALSNAPPSTPLVLFGSTAQGSLPFKGGTFYPVPVLLQIPLASNGSGALSLAGTMPGGTPSGLHLVLQAWMPAAGAPAGVAGSNGLLGVVP